MPSKCNYGDIPDTVPSKQYLPLGEHFYHFVRELGWEYFDKDFGDPEIDFFRGFGEVMRDKFTRSIDVAGKVAAGRIKDPENVYTTFFFPPVLYARSDLQAGGTKLLYGESVDVTYIIMNDSTHEIMFLCNCHMEGGIPVDYWIILAGDEVFDRRHIKRGYKLRNMVKKSKGLFKAGQNCLDVLRDIRNERTPEWAHSHYTMAMTWVSSTYNFFLDFSNYGACAALYDGVHAKKYYGLSDHYVCYVPWPPLIKTLLTMNRGAWTSKIAGLLSRNRLFINALEEVHLDFDKNRIPEVWEIMVRNMKERGVPTPKQTMGCTPPDFKDISVHDIHINDWKYPSGAWVKPYEWGLTDDEAFGGINTDIAEGTPPEPSWGKEHVISIGIGEGTRTLKKID